MADNMREPEGDIFDPINLLNRDLRRAAISLSNKEARYLVDAYYIMQENRKRANNQLRALSTVKEPHDIIAWLALNSENLESNIKAALGIYANSRPTGQWALSITGVGPVIAAGLLAHISMDHTPKISSLWRFAGQDPTSTWLSAAKARALVEEVMDDAKKVTDEHLATIGAKMYRDPEQLKRLTIQDSGVVSQEKLIGVLSKRPWNAGLKVLCFHIGESFVKVCNNEKDFYGKHYTKWKEIEVQRNGQGLFAEQAAEILKTRRIGANTVARSFYEQGMLPPAHIHARAKRKATKLFLSHYWEVAYFFWKGYPPAEKPYSIDILGHKHYISIPNCPFENQSTGFSKEAV